VGCGEPLYVFSPCRWCTCERCGIGPLNGFCPLCNSRNSCVYNPNPNSFDCPPDSYHPPYPTYETYSGDTCGNDSHFGYDCPPRFSLNYEPEPRYIQNYNSYPHDSLSFPQQYPCCEDCGVTHEPYQCQPKNHDYYHEQNSCYDYNSIGFDQSQPQHYTVNHPIFNAHHDLLDSQNKLTITLNKLAITQTKVTEQMTSLTSMCELACQIVQKKQEEKRIEEEQAAKAQNWNLPACYDDDDDEESSISLKDNIISELPPCSAVTPNEPVDSLSMGDGHLNTISTTKSDKFIKSSVENLVPNPSEFEGEYECDVPVGFTTFSNVLFDADYDFDSGDDQSFSDEDLPKKIYSNPLFDEEIIPMKIDQHPFNAEIDETDCHPEKETRFTKRFLYDNSSPRPPKEIVFDNSNVDIESFSPSPIPVEDSDSRIEEIDLSFNPDDPKPPGIEEDDDDSKRDILICEELPSNYSLSFHKNESCHFDIPSLSRPPAKPPDVFSKM
nr:pre-mRNA splicing Prp18-interacting factor [Tanacetum cinerariifolium]